MPITKPPLFPNPRPQFSRDLSLKQFSAYYWYKDELGAICRQVGLEAAGTKAELQTRIAGFLRSGKIPNPKRSADFQSANQAASRQDAGATAAENRENE